METILHLRHPLLHEPELLLDLVGGSHTSREHDARDRRDDGDQIGTHWESLLLGCRTLHSNLARSLKSGPPVGAEGIDRDAGPRASARCRAEERFSERIGSGWEEQVPCRIADASRAPIANASKASARSRAIARASARHVRRSPRSSPICTPRRAGASADEGLRSFQFWWGSKSKLATCSDGGSFAFGPTVSGAVRSVGCSGRSADSFLRYAGARLARGFVGSVSARFRGDLAESSAGTFL